MNYIALRIAAAALTPLLVFNAQPARCAPAAVPVTHLDHISIESVGKGPAIVLIPGLASPRAVWDGVVPELAKTHRVLLVQINGFAGDEPRANLKPGVIAGVVAELNGYLVANKIKDARIVGHSLGGLIALMFARDHAPHVARVMIVDSLPYVGLIFAPNATVATLEPTAKAIAAQMTASYGKPADLAAQTANAQRLALKPTSVATVAGWGAKADPRVVAQAFYEDMTTDLRPDMAKVATPITLVYPWSQALPKAKADAFYRGEYAAAPHVGFVDIGDSAHFVMLDQPEAFAAALKAFAEGK